MNEENKYESIIDVKNLSRIFRKHHESSEDIFSKIKKINVKKESE